MMMFDIQKYFDFFLHPKPFFQKRAKLCCQKSTEIIDICRWAIKEIYAEGSKEKIAVISPLDINKKFSFLVPKHRYLFKLSNPRHKHQFWMEIIAYRLGKRIGINICPTFVAKDSSKRINGSLTEWAYSDNEYYIPGHIFLSLLIPNYDLDKGKQHNFYHISRLNRIIPNLIDDVVFMLLFDCIIGNTDRHHSNWGIIFINSSVETSIFTKILLKILKSFSNKKFLLIMMLLDKYSQKYFCPLFDNGTSLGYEILEEKFDSFNINAYIKRGRHHMKFKLTDDNKDKFLGEQHLEMIKQLYYTYPKIVSSKLKKYSISSVNLLKGNY